MISKFMKHPVVSFLTRFGLSGLLLWYLSGKIDFQKTAEVMQSARIELILLGGFIFVFLNFVILYRWFIFIRALGLKSPVRDIMRFYFIGLAGNLFMPSAIGGDIIKIVGLCHGSDQKPKVVASVLLDRLSGFAGIVIVAIISFTFGYRLIEEPSVLVLIAMMGGASLAIALILFNETVYSFCCSVFNIFPKVKQALMNLHYDVMLLRDKKAEGFKAIGLSAMTHVITAFMWYLIAIGLKQDISFVYFLIFVPLVSVAASFPSIGGLGVREAGAAFLFSKVGMASGVAVSISLINFLYMVLIGVAGGVVYVFTVSSGRIQHNEPIKPAGV